MKGLIIWAFNNCRSTMAVYKAVQQLAPFPVKIVLTARGCGGVPEARLKTGFRADEFADVDMMSIDGDYSKGVDVMDHNAGFAHLFCAYQLVPAQRQLVCEATRRGERIFAAGEAPCNMSSGFRWLLKEVYLRLILRWKVRGVVRATEKFICFSGEAYRLTRLAGWPKEKVIPFGYYPPPVECTKCVVRTTNRPFVILATGILARYRGADVLVRALKILKDRGVAYRAIISQEGELLPQLKEWAKRYDLPIEFPGFLPMPELIKLYETCSVYVGAGRSEPWGMRLNDALNCGAPLLVSRGMGGVKLIDDYGCGLSCCANDALDMANQLEKMIADDNLYGRICEHVSNAVKNIAPTRVASWLLESVFKE